jgi:NADP-dependent 3-hydroxy acid dehydrogenase YdfG
MGALEGKVALVTGASSGVGKAIALALAARGADLCLASRRQDALEEVASKARSNGAAKAKAYATDLASDDEVRKMATAAQQDFGGIDILVHSAGTILLGEIANAPVQDFDRQYQVNVRAPYLLTQALLPTLRHRQGQVVFINSSAGITARAGVSQYAATKHALKAIADSLREEMNPSEVRVLSVFLGRTATPMQAEVHRLERKTYHPEQLIQPEDVADVVVNALSAPRTAEVTDLHVRPLKKP